MTKLPYIALHALMSLSATLVLLTGCISESSQDRLQAPPEVSAHPLPDAASEPYRLQVGDVMDVKVMLNPELSDQVTIRPDGHISTTMAQDVPAYGRTLAEVQDDLTKRYRTQLINPKVSVILRSFAPTRVYVLGEVNAPGEFITVGPSLTLLQAIARAGGVRNSAGTDKIIIIRHGGDNKPEAYNANYMAAASGRAPGDDVRLAPYDVVYVPRSDVGDVYLHFQQYVQQFLPASFGLGYQLNSDINN